MKLLKGKRMEPVIVPLQFNYRARRNASDTKVNAAESWVLKGLVVHSVWVRVSISSRERRKVGGR